MAWNKNYYSSKKCIVNGKSFDSKFESQYAQELEYRLKAHDIKSFESHIPIQLVVHSLHSDVKYSIGKYYIDFIVYHNDGTKEYVEIKGMSTGTWKMKWKVFVANTRDEKNSKITVIFQGKEWKPIIKKI